MSYFDVIDKLIQQGHLEEETTVGDVKLKFRTLSHTEETEALNRVGVNVLALKKEHLAVALLAINGQEIQDKDRSELREKLGKMPVPYIMLWYEPLDKLLKKVPPLTKEALKDPLDQTPQREVS